MDLSRLIRPLLCLVVFGFPAEAHCLPAQEPLPSGVAASNLDQLESWVGRFVLRDYRFERGEMDELRGLVRAAKQDGEKSPEALEGYIGGLLGVAETGLDDMPADNAFLGGGALRRVRRTGIEALEALLVGPEGGRCAQRLGELIADPSAPMGERRVAAWLSARRRLVPGRQALMTVGWNLEDPLRPDALFQLARWPDDAVDLFLVRLIGRPFESSKRPHPFHILLDRVEGGRRPLSTRAATELALRLGDMLISKDWRQAARAIMLSAGLQPTRRIPLLLAGLETWERRAARGTGSPRIADDIVRELRRISGRRIGPNRRRWQTWWEAVQAGQTPLLVEREDDEPRTSASFFGLRPVSDRVTFILDISGSMAAGWRTTDHSRYVEAIDQMMAHLQAMGENGKFNVILFSSDVLVSSVGLVNCTARNLERARESLLAREPRGGTRLRPAVEQALCLTSTGHVDLEQLEADTLVVLCDGDTNSGRGWVRPLLDRVQVDAQIRIHCVLIGTRGDGTLEALASATGGDFVRID